MVAAAGAAAEPNSGGNDVPQIAKHQDEFLALSDALKRRRGEEFEEHPHPAVLLDRATGTAAQVWGWWASTTGPQVPCLLWCTKRGWSTTAVEPDEIDAPGYELAHWSHRIKLLDLALANAHGPYNSLSKLELHVAADSTLPLGQHGPAIREGMLWGIVQLRAAYAQTRRSMPKGLGLAPAAPTDRLDADLAHHALVPTLPKKTPQAKRRASHKDPGLDALVQALAEVRSTGRLMKQQ